MRSTTKLLLCLALLSGCERSLAVPTEPSAKPPPAPAEAAAKPSSPEPEPPVATAPTEEQRAQALVEHVEALGELHRTHANDCAALADALEPFHAEHGAALRDAAPEVHAWIDAHEPLRTRVHAALEPVMTASMSCRGHARFQATQQALLGGSAEPEPG